MEIVPFVHFFSLIVYIYLAVFILLKNPASLLNRVCAIFSTCFALWNLGDIFIHSTYTSKEIARLATNINCIGWTSFSSFFIWVIIIFIDKRNILQKKLFYFLIFIFPAFFILTQWSGNLIIDWNRESWGWVSIWSEFGFDYLFYLYYLSFMIVALYFLLTFIRETKSPLKKKQARIFFYSTLIPLIIGTFTDVVLPRVTIINFPDLANIVTLIWVTGIVMAIVKYKFFILTPAMAEFTEVFNKALEQGSAVVYRRNFDLGTYEYMGEAIKDITGYSAKEITPAIWDEGLISAEIKGELSGLSLKEANNRVRTGLVDHWLSDSQICIKSGETRWVMDVFTVLRDTSGHCYGCLGILFDITDRKQTEKKLAQTSEELHLKNLELEDKVQERTKELSNANENLIQEILERKKSEKALQTEKTYLDQLFESAHEAIVMVGQNHRIQRVNSEFTKLFGYTRDEAVEQLIDDLIAPKELYEEAKLITKSVSEGNTANFESIRKRKDGTLIHVSVIASPIIIGDKKVGVYGIYRDITEKRKMEEELMKNQKLESLGVLAGGIAHDFRNILTGVLTNIWLAKEHAKNKGYIFKRLVEAEKATNQAKGLTQQLLTFSMGGAPIKEVASIGDLVYDTIVFVLRGSSVKEDISMQDDLWPVEVDTGQISQVIQNLIINAKQSMPQGGTVYINAENIRVNKKMNLPISEGNYIKISIRDEGVGIPKKHLQKIFDPFFTTKQEGSGLGLTTSFSIIQKHDGYITVESKMGEETTFILYLPAQEKVEIRSVDRKDEVTQAGKGKILIMDDEIVVRETLEELFKHFGYEVECVNEGSQAVKKYREAKEAGKTYDVVILDLTVPGGMGGKEVIKELLKIDPQVKAVAVSGYSNEPIIAEFTKYGFSATAVKPFEIEELSRTIYELTSR